MSPRHNGVELGQGSPLLTVAKAKRMLQPSEEDMQIAAMELLVGRARPGEPRRFGDGMTTRHPELSLLYAIPNGGARAKATAARMKAAGVLATLPDLHLPVWRGPWLSLYVELKRPGSYGTPEQRAMAQALRNQGHCVVECQGTQEVVNVILAYLRQRPLNLDPLIDTPMFAWYKYMAQERGRPLTPGELRDLGL